MGAPEEKQGGSHFLVDLNPRKVPAGTMSPRFLDSPRFRIPVHMKTGLHTLKHTLSHGDRFVDRLRLGVFGVLVVLAMSGVTLWMVRDRQVLLGELVEAKELQLSWEAGRRGPVLCRDVEEWKGLVDEYRRQVEQLQLQLENQRSQLRDGLINLRANPVHREQGGDRDEGQLQELRSKPSTCFDSDFYKGQHAHGQHWSHEDAWHDFFAQGYRAGHAFTFHC
eukprot:TRINITY_DN15699_c0_g1_i1.p1 TRINITY_DN15699_c0_g1~~TRINITY_DN15699_c0_g1_i1.p1  ORF type:complete len:222 (+),score=40.63 TRINITY_DN15699_c0_g1_i1:863-1528(+)